MTTWEHYAHSVPQLAASGRYSFSIPRGVSGAALTLSDGEGRRRHGLLFQGGAAQVLEDGARIGPILPFEAHDRWHLVRIGQAVYYCRADAAPDNEAQARAAAFWFSRIPCAGAARLHADLLSPGDTVVDAEIKDFAAAGPAPLPPSLNGAGVRVAWQMRAKATPGGVARVQVRGQLSLRAVQPPHLAGVRIAARVRVAATGAPPALRFDVALPAIAGGKSSHAAAQLGAGARAGARLSLASHLAKSGARAGDAAALRGSAALSASAGVRAGWQAALQGAARLTGGLKAGDAWRVQAAAQLAAGARAGDGAASASALSIGAGSVAGGGPGVAQRGALTSGVRAGGGARVAQHPALACAARAGDAARLAGGAPLALACGARAGDAARAWTLAVGVADGAIAADDLLAREAGIVAWLMNAETGAVSWWDNWQFTDAVQLPDGRVLAVGPAGISEWTGALDDGQAIEARLTWGLLELGGYDDAGAPVAAEKMKRITQMTVGYHARWPLQATLHAFGSGHPPAVFAMPPQVAGQALLHRNHRITPAKGLLARYWRIQLSGRGPWQVHGITADVAASARRL